MTLILTTAANRPYMDRIAPYLHTIQEHGWRFDQCVLITVGCQVEMPPELNGIEAFPLPATQVRGHTGNFCIQQGCFLDVLGAAPDDVIIFTDGDVRMQRAPTDNELAWMRAIPYDTIAMGWNAGPHDTLMEEARRIGLAEDGHDLFQGWLYRKVYNCGVIVCRAATYWDLYQRYLLQWDAFIPYTQHYAANQFLICACVAQMGLRVWEMDPRIHTHGCFGLPEYAREVDEGGTLAIGDELVLFRHHWKC